MRPSGPAGVRIRPVPCPGMASVGTPDRSAKCAKKERYGTYSPNGTRCTFSNTPTTRPSGPHATTLLRKVVDDAGSVTPTTSVVWSLRAKLLSNAASGEPANGRFKATTFSGHSTSSGRGCTDVTRELAATCASKTLSGGTCSLLTP